MNKLSKLLLMILWLEPKHWPHISLIEICGITLKVCFLHLLNQSQHGVDLMTFYWIKTTSCSVLSHFQRDPVQCHCQPEQYLILILLKFVFAGVCFFIEHLFEAFCTQLLCTIIFYFLRFHRWVQSQITCRNQFPEQPG